jgi:hypothetical protein
MMKTNILLYILFGFSGLFWAQKGDGIQFTNPKALSDTIVFDIDNATYYTNSGSDFIDIPVLLKSTDLTINSFDFWFQFNTNELTYVSTASLIAGLDAFSNFNQANFYLSNTSSGTSINFNIPTNTPVIKLTFQLAASCALINSQDFNNVTTLFDGDVSSYKFTAPAPSPIQVLSSLPTCSHNYITFSYDSLYSGKPITQYSWDFANADFSSLQTDSTIFTQSGNFSVLLDVVTSDGCSYSTSYPIEITEGPLASFTYTQGGTQTEVVFTNTSSFSSGIITDFHWDFGDGQSSSQENPTATFPGADTYPVTLTVVADNGCENSTTSMISTVGLQDIDLASIHLNPNPAHSIISIHSPFEIGEWVILDQSGKVFLNGNDQNSQMSISVEQFAAGIYHLQIGSQQFKFVKH